MSGVVLTCVEARALLEGRREGKPRAGVSIDLGRSTVEAALEPEGVRFSPDALVRWPWLEEIRDAEQACFVLEGQGLRKVQAFSQATNRFYVLMPTETAPTVLSSGIPMHRIKEIDPLADTRRKIRCIAPVVGAVLDTATGLGYTAIEAAKTATAVTTIELDPAMLDVARRNPWSRELFDHPNIERLIGDSSEEIRRFDDASFSRIIHDPPMFSLAGELYSGAFYRQLYRVLKEKGRLLHYVGNLESKLGRNVARGVTRRLKEAGFSRVVPRREAFGLVARK
jgi:predicted methyltransferase